MVRHVKNAKIKNCPYKEILRRNNEWTKKIRLRRREENLRTKKYSEKIRRTKVGPDGVPGIISKALLNHSIIFIGVDSKHYLIILFYSNCGVASVRLFLFYYLIKCFMCHDGLISEQGRNSDTQLSAAISAPALLKESHNCS